MNNTLYNNKEEEKVISDYLALRQVRRDNKKSIVKKDGLFLTSIVYTDPKFAKKIIQYFSPQFKLDDTFIDPCAGHNAFYDNLPETKTRCEIQDGIDYLKDAGKYDWCFANYPWRGKVYTQLINHSFQTCDNVVSLVKFAGAIGTQKRFRDMQAAKHGIKEIIFVDWNEANFTFSDGTNKLKEGFILSVIHYRKNWKQGTEWNEWK
jgi:hypothetical protein